MSQTPTLARTILEAIEGRLTGLHTMLPGEVVAVNTALGTCDVQPSLMRLGVDGNPVKLPVITNCPIGHYRAGQAAIYLPLAIGHKVEIRFCERSIDIWLTKGGTVDPEDARKHHLSDAVVYPGLYDLTDPPLGVSATDIVIVNEDSKLELAPDGRATLTNLIGTFEMSSAGKFQMTGPTGELLTLIAALISELETAITLDPLTGPMPTFSAATLSALDVIKTQIQGITE